MLFGASLALTDTVVRPLICTSHVWRDSCTYDPLMSILLASSTALARTSLIDSS